MRTRYLFCSHAGWSDPPRSVGKLERHGDAARHGRPIRAAPFHNHRRKKEPEMTPDLCIYHGQCDDGFGAAFAVWKRDGDCVTYHAGVYGKAPPLVAGLDVAVVDFSYKRPVMVEIAKSAASILVLDHHKTA